MDSNVLRAMSPTFSARASSLRELLSGATYLVTPGFQRPYSWTTREVGQLCEDLLEALDEHERRPSRTGVYFLGTIILIERKPGAGEAAPRYQIIDGQQRLVTLTMQYAILRELARSEGDPEHADTLHERIEGGQGFRVSIGEAQREFLREHVQQTDACLNSIDARDLESPEKDIIQNRELLMKELRGLDRDTRRRLASFLDERCQLVVIITDDTDSAYRIFMVVNGPGKPLSRSDILKAELLAEVPADRREPYVTRWNAAERKVGIADFERLFSHLRSALGNPHGPIIAEIRRLARVVGGQRFLEETVLPMADVLAAMLDRDASGLKVPAKGQQLLRYLDWLSHSDWVPPAILWLARHRSEPPAMQAFLEAADRYAYGQLYLGIGRNKRIDRYGDVIEMIRKGESPLGERGPFMLTAEDQRNIQFNVTNDAYGRGSQACKLLLLRLNDAVAGKPAGIAPSEVSVEHVLPQRPGRNSQWRDWFSDSVREYYTGSLGNLILVKPPTNAEVRNYDLERKLARFKEDEKLARLPLFADILKASRWTPDAVQAREDRMVEALRGLWKLSGNTGRKRPAGR
jgi:hypothetical protein